MSNIAFVDTETTGLDPDRHEVWEVGLIAEEGVRTAQEWVEHEWQLHVDLSKAEPYALQITRFHDRYNPQNLVRPSTFAQEFADLTRGKHLAGAVVSFDEERLRKLLRAHGQCPMWHYHILDVEAYAAGWLGLDPPWDSEQLSSRVGVDPGKFDRHTALGDALWAKAIYDAVRGAATPERTSNDVG